MSIRRFAGETSTLRICSCVFRHDPPTPLSAERGGSFVAMQARRRLLERRSNDHIRHGTTSLFAALDVAFGFVICKCYKRRRAKEFLSFLKEIDARVAGDLDIHIIINNYATHKTKRVKAWRSRRPHYHVHFTPTSTSWINQVERWFAELTRK